MAKNGLLFQVAKAEVASRRATAAPLRTTLELAECVAGAVRTREKGQHPGPDTFRSSTDLPQSGARRRARARPRVSSKSCSPRERVGGDQFPFARRPHGQAVHRRARPRSEAHDRACPRAKAGAACPAAPLGRVLADEAGDRRQSARRSAVLRAIENTDTPLPVPLRPSCPNRQEVAQRRRIVEEAPSAAIEAGPSRRSPRGKSRSDKGAP